MVFQENNIYGWRPGTHIKADAQQAGEMIEALRNSGGLSTQRLLDANRKEGTVLHNEFEWDDGKAAEEYRLNQAAHIIRSIVVVQQKDEDQEEDREPVQVPVKIYYPTHAEKGEYERVDVLLKNEDSRRKLLNDCLSELKAFQRKYSSLKELADMLAPSIGLIEQYIAELEDKANQNLQEGA